MTFSLVKSPKKVGCGNANKQLSFEHRTKYPCYGFGKTVMFCLSAPLVLLWRWRRRRPSRLHSFYGITGTEETCVVRPTPQAAVATDARPETKKCYMLLPLARSLFCCTRFTLTQLLTGTFFICHKGGDFFFVS